MTTWLITRHPGALNWANKQQLPYDQHRNHLIIEQIQPGDILYGTLPVTLIAAVNDQGARYFHLEMDLPEAQRGMELTTEQLEQLKARWVEYQARRIET